VIDASVVIVSYNTRDLLRDCLGSVSAGCGDLRTETFVVDNASPDGSCDMVAQEFPAVRLVRNPCNAGFAAANNIVLRKAAGRYVVLLNPDTVLSAGALPELMRFMDATPAAGYCGPRLLNADGSHQPSARRFPTTLSGAFAMLSLGHHRPNSRHALDLHRMHGDRSRFRTDWLTGACLVVRTEAMRQVGDLNEGFFMYFEETDWCRRMASAGWEGWYVPSAEVVHLGGASVGLNETEAPFFGNHPSYWVSSRCRYMRRHHGVVGMLICESLDVALYAALWLRHRWRATPESRLKARRASTALRHLLQRNHRAATVRERRTIATPRQLTHGRSP